MRKAAIPLIVIGLSLILIVWIGARWLPGAPTPTVPPTPAGLAETAAPSRRPAAALKMATDVEGLYRVDASQLKAAGIDLAKTPLASLELTIQGRPQPAWLAADGQGLIFFAPASQRRYNTFNLAWLVSPGDDEDEAARLRQMASAPAITPTLALEGRLPGLPAAALPPGTLYTSQRFEQNLIYSPKAEGGEHWFWISVPAPQKKSIQIEVAAVEAGPAALRLGLQAATDSPEAMDHRLILRLNGQPVADESWDGRANHIISTALPQGLLKAGENTLELEAPGLEGVQADILQLNWVAVDYARRLASAEGQIAFLSDGSALDLTPLGAEALVFDITDVWAPARLEKSAQGYAFEKGRFYLAARPEGLLTPAQAAAPISAPDLRSNPPNADWIAIGPADLLEAVKPLAEFRAGQGLMTAMQPLDAIYDQFGQGFAEPGAIWAYLENAYRLGQPKPRYVLLVGDATYDPRGYLSAPEANRLPVFFVNTYFGGETASDVAYGIVGPDAWPVIAIGRIPAQTPAQVQLLVEKILAYEQTPLPEGGARHITAIADGQDPSFRDDAQVFLDLFPQSIQSELYAPEAGVTDASATIQTFLTRGDLLVAYFGHGSVNMWGKDRLFTAKEVSGLSTPARLPVLINLTCLTGLFTHPKVESLTEAFLWQPGGGAVAALAPTSLTLPSDQSFLSSALVEALLAEPAPRLGDVLLQARRQVPIDAEGTLDVLNTYLLFGDPALRIPFQAP